MQCPLCGTSNAKNAKFCSTCLARFSQRESTERETAVLEAEAQDGTQIEVFDSSPTKDVSAGQKALGVAVGAFVGLALTAGLHFLPVPFVYLLGPAIGAALTGRLIAERGGRYGAMAAILPAAAIVVQRFATAGAARSAVRHQMASLGADFPRSILAPIQNLLAPPPALLAVLVLVTVALVLALGYYGGRYGERLAKGVGFGMSGY